MAINCEKLIEFNNDSKNLKFKKLKVIKKLS